jgi:[ribosomal protein S5]-alanine N-acetyltransferase
MLNKSDLMTFVATCNAAKARRFYEETLGLTFVSDDQFALVFKVNETILRIQKVDRVNPYGYTVLGWKVSDINKEVIALAQRGVKFARYEGMHQDEYEIWTAPSNAKIVWFTDPDGNILSLTEFPEQEKHGEGGKELLFYETDRLVLRSLQGNEIKQLNEYLIRNKEFLSLWEPARDEEYFSEKGVTELVEKQNDEIANRKGIYLYIFLKDGHNLIGSISVSNIIFGAFQSCFLSYKIDEQEINKGYMTEAMRKVIEICFREYSLHRIEANVIPKNERSIRVLKKLGFIEEGRSPQYLKIKGTWTDHIHYVLLNGGIE